MLALKPNPPNSADANGDANINILDVTHLVNYLYKSGTGPTAMAEAMKAG